jgi:integrase
LARAGPVENVVRHAAVDELALDIAGTGIRAGEAEPPIDAEFVTEREVRSELDTARKTVGRGRAAEDELQNDLADVRRGIWHPPAPRPHLEIESDPTFHRFVSEWFTAHRGEWAPNAALDYEWQLRSHFLPFFALHRLSQITIAEVDRYRQDKVDERSLSAESINKTITRLGQILEVAVEYELVARNPVRVNPRRRKLKAARARPVHLDGVDQVVALLDAARDLDGDAKSRASGRYALIAALVFAGTRDDEVSHALVRDVDLARSRFEVGRSKTAAGLRTIDLLPVLHDILAEHKASRAGGLDDLLFSTARGGRRDTDNIYERVLKPVLERADELLADPASIRSHEA